MKEFISQIESPSKFSFQPEQNSPLSKNIETEDAIKQVFEMYFNQEIPHSPKFNSPSEKYQKMMNEVKQNEQENRVDLESYLNLPDQKGNLQQQQQDKTPERNVLSDITNQNSIKNINIQAFGKMQELGETIKNSLSSIHQKYSETKFSLNDLSKSRGPEEQQEYEKRKLNDIWDSQLNQYYQDFLNNAQDALLKATGTPGKFPKNKINISKSSAQKFPTQKLSAQKFSTSKVQHPPWNSSKQQQQQLQQQGNLTRRLTGSAQKFSTISKNNSLNYNKPMSVQKFPNLSGSGISLRSSNLSQQGKNSLSNSQIQQQKQQQNQGKQSASKSNLIKQQQQQKTVGKLSTGKSQQNGIISKSKDIKKIVVPSRFSQYNKK
ncbi:hypothetical protein PPERSA_12472 [Pseudocohnilembus persalinus]|uniref:Uncharacterized protein n=1 Tax=Pseudocohnilembus persalinus TaxID=266149 RepID=A0A0V0QNZ2_PSEPJ|nr:hypothetical protein PPERSA_12472 [Pseudocohnilembus persalinus]|eukprot:KRX04025.1 hypothetical protein PPERSA_12472 [Pseudocohnilembus persalinus]